MTNTRSWLWRLSNILVPPEPPPPSTVLDEHADRFRDLAGGVAVCIKLSAAYDLPYPFTVSASVVARVVDEIRAVNSSLRILLTEGGVGRQAVVESARVAGLFDIPGAEFVDAESAEQVFVANPLAAPHTAHGFWLPAVWVNAGARVLLTTCKLRSQHFQRWYSGGTRNLIGLMARSRYSLPSSRRQMRSMVHQRGMDAMIADLYATAGRNVLTALDGRAIARQDEHLPLRFNRRFGRMLVADDPYRADREMAALLKLPFVPRYLERIEKDRDGSAESTDVCSVNERE